MTIGTVDSFTHGPAMRRTSSAQQQLSLAPASESASASGGHRSPPAAPQSAPHAPIVILRLPDVCRITGLCRSLVYELESNGTFPRRVPLGARSVGWVEAEVQSWLAARVLARGAAPAARGTANARTRASDPRASGTRFGTPSARFARG